MKRLVLSVIALYLGYFSIEFMFDKIDALSLLKESSIIRISQSEVEINLSGLTTGDYLLSVARPRGKCAITEGETVFATNHSFSPFRASLYLSYPFSVRSEPYNRHLKISCVQDGGFPSVLGINPVLTSQRTGTFLHLIRSAIQTGVGPLLSILGLIVMGGIVISRRKVKRATWERLLVIPYSVGFLYSISLTHFFWLFLDSRSATILHIIIRTVFVFSLAYLIRLPKWLYWINASLFATSLGIVVYSARTEAYLPVYSYGLLFFGVYISAIGLLIYHLGKDTKSLFISSTLVTYGVYHYAMSYGISTSLSGNFLGFLMPNSILWGTLCFMWMSHSRWLELVRLKGYLEVEIATNKDFDASENIVRTQIRNAFFKHFAIKRKKARTSLSLSEIRSAIRNTSSQEREVFFSFRRDLLDAVRKVRELNSLKKLDLISTYLRNISALDLNVAASVFILDLNNYSKNCSNFGVRYIAYIRDTFLPKFISESSIIGCVEAARGDEIVFVVCTEAVAGSAVHAKKIEDAVHFIEKFLESENQYISREFGFPAQTFSVGLATGNASIVSRGRVCALSSAPYIQARRIASACSMDRVLSDQFTGDLLANSESIKFGESFPVIVKKDLLQVRDVFTVTNTKSAA